jgi:hypothetical protein
MATILDAFVQITEADILAELPAAVTGDITGVTLTGVGGPAREVNLTLAQQFVTVSDDVILDLAGAPFNDGSYVATTASFSDAGGAPAVTFRIVKDA